MCAKLFGIVHEAIEETRALKSVRPFFKKGRTIWVEHHTLYPKIIREAKRASMKVLSLDSKFARKMLRWPSSPHQKLMSTGDKRYLTDFLERYVMHNVRERSRLPRIRQAGREDIVVMHPVHARAIAKELFLPNEDIPLMQKVPEFFRARSYPRLTKPQYELVHTVVSAIRREFRDSKRRRREALKSLPADFNELKRILKTLQKRRK